MLRPGGWSDAPPPPGSLRFCSMFQVCSKIVFQFLEQRKLAPMLRFRGFVPGVPGVPEILGRKAETDPACRGVGWQIWIFPEYPQSIARAGRILRQRNKTTPVYIRRGFLLVHPTGFEPATFGFGGHIVSN